MRAFVHAFAAMVAKLNSLVLIFIFLFASPAVAGDFDFMRIPSFVSLQVGGSDQDSRNGSLQAGITVGENWQIGFGVDGGRMPGVEDDESLQSRGANVSLASDPLNTFSAQVTGESWSVEEHVQASGIRASATVALSNWTFTLLGGGQNIRFTDLPAVIWPEEASIVEERSYGGAVEYFGSERWSFRFSAMGYSYDQDLTDYTKGVRILVISPEVLTSATGFYSSQGSLSGSLYFGGSNYTLTMGSTRSAVDDIRTSSAGLSWGYRVSKRWSTLLGMTAYKPEDASEEERATFSFLSGLTYTW